MQKFYSEPREDGKYYVVSKNMLTGEMEETPIEAYSIESEAKQRAHELNEEYNKELKEDEENQNNNQNPTQNEEND